MGLTRFLLAMWVVDGHGGSVWPGELPHVEARASVQLFYVISGFYMTLVLNTKYCTPGDNITFYMNRFLRLWPPFFVFSVVTVAIFLVWNRVVLFHLDLPLESFIWRLSSFDPITLLGLAVTNIMIFGQDLLWYFRISPSGVDIEPFQSSPHHNGSSFSINHPIFTVAIELTFYIAAPFVLRKSVGHIVCWLLAGASYHLGLHLTGRYDLAFSYHTFFSAIYFFALGACSYHLWRRIDAAANDPRARQRIWLCVGAAALLAIFVARIFQTFEVYPMLALAPAFAALVPIMFSMTRRSTTDRILGDLSYPIYIVHYPVLTVLVPAILPFLPDQSYGRYLEGPMVLASAILLFLLVDLPIDRTRQRLARRAAPRIAGESRSAFAPPRITE